MEIHSAALKHGVAAEDIEHAVRNAMTIVDLDEDLRLYLGPSRHGTMLEVVTVIRSDDCNELVQVPAPSPWRVKMAQEKNYGHTVTGELITESLIEELAAEAERGFDVDEIIRRRSGRPSMGSGPASVESVRLDPELEQALKERAEREGRTNSDVIRDALRRYLEAS